MGSDTMMQKLTILLALMLAATAANAGPQVTGDFTTASPSVAFSPNQMEPFTMMLTGALPTGLALKCSIDGGSTYHPIVVENTQMYVPTAAGKWSYQTNIAGEKCRWEYTGTAAGTFVFAQ